MYPHGDALAEIFYSYSKRPFQSRLEITRSLFKYKCIIVINVPDYRFHGIARKATSVTKYLINS